MKSLKRTLCLVLALVMVLGLFGIASATNFTDDNTIQYKEAVEVITGIGAIKGMGDGTFAPKGTITRAQAATMVARVALTNKIADDLKGVTSSFTDVTVEGGFAWAIPSIEYLVSNNIINGMGDGTFNPNGEISGYAVLKMLLCVLGYGANDEYVGTGWDLKVAVDANKYGLSTGRVEGTPALSQPATREEVALYCYNALGTETVSYNALQNRYEKGTANTSAYVNGKAPTLADNVYGIKAVEGIVTSNQSMSTNKYTTVTVVNDRTVANTTKGSEVKLNIATGLDMVGHYVTAYYKTQYVSDSNPGVAYSIVDNSTVVNVTATTPVNSAQTWANVFGTAKPVGNTLSVSSGTNYSNQMFVFDGAYGSSATADVRNGTTVVWDSGNGNKSDAYAAATGTYILHNNVIYTFIVPTTYKADVVSEVKAATASTQGHINFVANATTSMNLTIPATSDTTSTVATNYAKYKIDDVAKNDVVYQVEAGPMKNIVKAPVVAVKVKAVDTTKNTLTATDGTVYKKSSVTTLLADSKPFAAFNNELVNAECALYLGPDGSVIAIVPKTEVATNMMYVVNAYVTPVADEYGQNSTYLVKVQGIDLETGKEINVVVGAVNGSASSAIMIYPNVGIKYDDGSNNTASAPTAKYWVTQKFAKYATSYNDTMKTDLTTLSACDTAGAEVVAVGSSAIDGTSKVIGTTTNYLSTNTKFVYVTTLAGGTPDAAGTPDKLKVSSANFPQKIEATPNYDYFAVKDGNGTNADVKYIVVKATPSGTEGTSLMFVPEKFTDAKTVSYTKADGTVAKAYSNAAFIDGAPVEVLTSAAPSYAAGFYKYTVTDSLYSLTPVTEKVGTAYVKNVKGSLITLENPKGTAISALTNVDASGAFITDVPYIAAVASKNPTLPTQHTDLASLQGTSIAFTYKTDATGANVITGIYFISATQQSGKALSSVTLKIGNTTIGTLDSSSLASPGSCSATATTGTYTKDAVVTATAVPAAGSERAKIVVTDGKVPAANSGTATVTITVSPEDGTAAETYSITVAFTGSTINT